MQGEYIYRNCTGCKYFRKNFPEATNPMCQYSTDTKTPRNCAIDTCDKKVEKRMNYVQ